MSTLKVNTIVGADGSSGVAIKGFSDGSAATTGSVGEFGITQMTSNVTIQNAQATLLSMTLQRGSYTVGYDLCVDVTSSAAVKTHIQVAGVHQTYSAAYVGGPASGTITFSVSRRIFVEVATATSYDLMCDGGSDSGGTIFGNGALSGNIGDPDNASTFWWERRR